MSHKQVCPHIYFFLLCLHLFYCKCGCIHELIFGFHREWYGILIHIISTFNRKDHVETAAGQLWSTSAFSLQIGYFKLWPISIFWEFSYRKPWLLYPPFAPGSYLSYLVEKETGEARAFAKARLNQQLRTESQLLWFCQLVSKSKYKYQ